LGTSNSAELAQWVESIATTVAVIGALIIAIFQDRMRAWVMRPELDASVDTKSPDCLKIDYGIWASPGKLLAVGNSYYLRIKVENKGKMAAESVEVFADRLLRLHADGSFQEVKTFLPMNLKWANIDEAVLPVLHPHHTYRHCNVAHIIKPEHRSRFSVQAEDKQFPDVPPEKTILSFDTSVKAHTMSHLAPPGKYHLVVVLSAANAEPVEKTLEINLTGDWYDSEPKMFESGVGIRLV
jgi:hypothetical protein